jgi:hypothetical protein
MRTFVRCTAAVVAALTLGAASARAQNPVPVGEVTVTLNGRVVGTAGAALPGVRVEVTNASGWTKALTTAPDGRFSLPGLPSGKYVIAASLAGFSTNRTEVTLSAGAASPVTITLSGPVPVGESGQPPQDVEAVRKTFADDLALQTWLKTQSAAGLRLVAVVPIADKTSLFVFRHVPAEPNATIVMAVAAALDADGLSARLAQNGTRTFIGVHRLSASSYLLILR